MPPEAVVNVLVNECELNHLRLAYGSDQSSHASLQRVESPVNQVGWGHRCSGRSVGGSSLWSLVGRPAPNTAGLDDNLILRWHQRRREGVSSGIVLAGGNTAAVRRSTSGR